MQDSKSMAVRALEGDGDTIYRQDAIDAMNRLPKWSDDLFSAVCLDYSDVISVLSDTEKLPSAQPERQPPTEDDYAYCAECNSVEMCRWYPLYGCQFRSLPSAQPEIIRCKDCYWWNKQEDSPQGRCSLHAIYPTGGWYCANGRRKEGKQL